MNDNLVAIAAAFVARFPCRHRIVAYVVWFRMPPPPLRRFAAAVIIMYDDDDAVVPPVTLLSFEKGTFLRSTFRRQAVRSLGINSGMVQDR